MPYTVTQRIRAVEQPAEGYIPITKFSVKKYEDFCQLHYKENISANYVGLAVDYLTRFYITKNIKCLSKIFCHIKSRQIIHCQPDIIRWNIFLVMQLTKIFIFFHAEFWNWNVSFCRLLNRSDSLRHGVRHKFLPQLICILNFHLHYSRFFRNFVCKKFCCNDFVIKF